MTGPVMDEVGDLTLRPEVVQAGIILQAVLYPLIQVGDGEYLGQDRSIWTGSIFKGDSTPKQRGVPISLEWERSRNSSFTQYNLI
jgi:hypothetical protein